MKYWKKNIYISCYKETWIKYELLNFPWFLNTWTWLYSGIPKWPGFPRAFAANPGDRARQAGEAGVCRAGGEIPGSGGERRENHQPAATETPATRQCQGDAAQTQGICWLILIVRYMIVSIWCLEAASASKLHVY